MTLFKKVALGTAIVGAAAAATTRLLVRRRARSAPVITELPPVTIELADDYDVTFWMRRLGVTKQQLRSAVAKVGPRADAVTELLSV